MILKFSWANFSKLFSHLIAFTSLHKHTVSHFLPQCQCVCSQEYPKTSSFSWIFVCKNSSLIKATDSCSLHWSHYIVVNLSHITLTLNHFMMYICRWWRNWRVRKYCLRWKLYSYSSPTHLTPKILFLSLCFLSFVHFFPFRFLVSWDYYCKFARFDSLRPLKKY